MVRVLRVRAAPEPPATRKIINRRPTARAAASVRASTGRTMSASASCVLVVVVVVVVVVASNYASSAAYADQVQLGAPSYLSASGPNGTLTRPWPLPAKSQPAYELRFQIEPDNVTVFKREQQQQTYKCQVRLAPVASSTHSSPGAARSHLGDTSAPATTLAASRSSPTGASPVPAAAAAAATSSGRHALSERGQPLASPAAQFAYRQLANVTLAIEWLKDDKPLARSGQTDAPNSGPINAAAVGEPISVVNVELSRGRQVASAAAKGLRAASSSSSGGGGGPIGSNVSQPAQTNKRNSTSDPLVLVGGSLGRIEIKNTLNSNQLKLTSRLKLSRLRQSDSAAYRCVARATYLLPITTPPPPPPPPPATREAGAVAESESRSNGGADLAARRPSQPLAQTLAAGPATWPTSSTWRTAANRFELIEQTLESGAASSLMVIASDASGAGGGADGPQQQQPPPPPPPDSTPARTIKGTYDDSLSASVAPTKVPPTSSNESQQSSRRSRPHLSPPADANKVNPSAGTRPQSGGGGGGGGGDDDDGGQDKDNNIAPPPSSHWTRLWSDFSLAPSGTHTKGVTQTAQTDKRNGSNGRGASATSQPRDDIGKLASVANESHDDLSQPPRRLGDRFEDDEDLFRLDYGSAPSVSSNVGGDSDADGSAEDTGSSVDNEPSPPTDLISGDQQSLQDQLSQLVWSSLSSVASTRTIDPTTDERDNERALLLFPFEAAPVQSETRADNVESGHFRTDDTRSDNQAVNESSDDEAANEVHSPPSAPDRTHRRKYRPKTAAAAAAAADTDKATGRASSGGLNGAGIGAGAGVGLANRGGARAREASSSTAQSARHLTHFMHAISPTLSCYTNNGAQYAGNISTSSDGRECLSWTLVQQLVLRTIQLSARQAAQTSNTTRHSIKLNSSTMMLANIKNNTNYNHNHCRNPSHDPRGPYCYVIYSELYDGPIEAFKVTAPPPSPQPPLGGQQQAPNGAQRYVVARQCSVARCSEYLWLMVAAPPVVVLVLLICIMIALVRSIRRSRYNAIFASSNANSYRKCQSSAKLPEKLGRLTGNCATRVLNAKKAALSVHTAAAKAAKSYGGYLAEDAFEIVDDLDWSDSSCAAGSSQMTKSQSLSPKSSESFRLNHSATTCSSVSQCDKSDWPNGSAMMTSHLTSDDAPSDQRAKQVRPVGATTYKSMNPIFNERIFDNNHKLMSSVGETCEQTAFMGAGLASSGLHLSRKPSAEPMFATLRCPVRAKQSQARAGLNDDSAMQSHQARLNKCLTNKSNSFIGKPAELSAKQRDKLGSDQKDLTAFGPGKECKNSTVDNADYQSIADSDLRGSSEKILNVDECPIKGSVIEIQSLPQLVASSVAVKYDHQPIFEGKFSQVHLARYLKLEPKVSTQQAADIGAQVAVFSLKHTADDELNHLFSHESLKVLNLNHLNVTKLIGYTTFADLPTSPMCALVYDMAQLIDLQDWLKQQARDTAQSEEQTIQNKSGTSLRQNLACFAKQIALALDYLHDKNIIFKDLASRNCFLDPTKMLVKLASFNLEPVMASNVTLQQSSLNIDSKVKQVKSMIRPNHLPDYYVVDSRPTECQLLPLSWIPLESILFNKFNEQTDIWSFGCLLHELYSFGEVPFFGYSSKSIIDAVRANIMPRQPMLCPDGIYRLMCKCLSDIPTLRPNVKQVYEHLILYSGQCSSFLDHHLCSLATLMSHSKTQPTLVPATSGLSSNK